MLLGTEIGAALTALEPFDVDAIGLNCATGPKEMNDAVRYLGLNSTKHISILPNAGLPANEGWHAVFKLSRKSSRNIIGTLLPTMAYASWAAAAARRPSI